MSRSFQISDRRMTHPCIHPQPKIRTSLRAFTLHDGAGTVLGHGIPTVPPRATEGLLFDVGDLRSGPGARSGDRAPTKPPLAGSAVTFQDRAGEFDQAVGGGTKGRQDFARLATEALGAATTLGNAE